MKPSRLIACAVLALGALAGCNTVPVENIDLDPEGRTKHFVAGFEEPTRTAVDADGKTSWCAGDRIRYYSAVGGSIGSTASAASGRHFDFEASVGDDDTLFIAAYGGTGITDNTARSFVLTGAVPAVQSGRFEDAHVAVAKTVLTAGTDPQSIIFKNLTSLIKFTLTRDDVAKVVIMATGGEALHGNGDVNVYVSNGLNPTFVGDKSNAITVNTGGAGTFYIATLPAPALLGFTAICYDAAGAQVAVATGAKNLTLYTNGIIDLGTIDSHVRDIPEILASATDLSLAGTANSYIVSGSGTYKFKATKGNTNDPVGDVKGVKVLWETFGTSTKPAIGSIIAPAVVYRDGYVAFSTAASFHKGNAVIAAYSDEQCTYGNVLWSWHIWCTDKPADQQYAYNAGVVMDRNLGAVSATPGDVGALGLLYQWGRKDPFMGWSSISSSNSALSTVAWPNKVDSDEQTGTVDYAVSHPMTGITGNTDTRGDWLYGGNSTANPDLWVVAKGAQDPCPPGYRVPDNYQEGIWSTPFGDVYTAHGAVYDNVNRGYNFGSSNPCSLGDYPVIWYPKSPGYWTCLNYPIGTPPNAAICMVDATLCSVFGKATYLSVRCQSTETPPIVPISSITLSNKNVSLMVGQSVQVTAECLPANANRKTVNWRVQNESVATIDHNGNITAVAVGTTNFYASNFVGNVHATGTITVTEPVYTDLSNPASANCYIVSKAGCYRFKAVKGNSSTNVSSSIQQVRVLWESFGTDTAPAVGDIIDPDVTYEDHYIKFKTNGNFRKGNAVIGAYSGGVLVWSWHIWCTDAPKDHKYLNGAGSLMDRNLGATSATPGDVQASGLLYQWGRKDPFMGPAYTANASSSNQTQAASTITWPVPATSKSGGTIAYTIGKPTVFILGNTSSHDWLYSSGSSAPDNTRWAATKTIYDPCPPGYRVPDGGTSGVWAKALGSSEQVASASTWDDTGKGMNFSNSSVYYMSASTPLWYPASGFLSTVDGTLNNASSSGYSWSCTPSEANAYYFYFANNGHIIPADYSYRACAMPVRCLKTK